MASAVDDDATRDSLLRAAHHLLEHEGPSALTVRRIANDAGVSTMNVYSRFGGKDGVIDELFVDGFVRLGQAMLTLPETADVLADLRACGDAYRRFARRAPTYYSLMFDRVVPDYVPSDGARAVAYATFEQLVAKAQRAIDAGAIAGRAETIAGGMWALVHGLASLDAITALDHQAGTVAPFDWDAISDHAIAVFVLGLHHQPDPVTTA